MVQVYLVPERPGVAWINTYCDREDGYCAILAEVEDHEVQLGDTLWWQAGKAHWTSGSLPVRAVTLKKIGCSGVNHPLGKQYEIRSDFKPMYQRKKEQFKKLGNAVWDVLIAHHSEGPQPISSPQLHELQQVAIDTGLIPVAPGISGTFEVRTR